MSQSLKYNLTPLCQNLLPKRTVLEEVWRGARQCLYEPKTVPPAS